MFFFGEDIGVMFDEGDEFDGQIEEHVGFGGFDGNLFHIIEFAGDFVLVGVFIVDVFLDPEGNE